ncbi:hypothetical protein GF366_03645 [Candidatus Peregrinibacteria bacterium]|nr:hypothetical protein [Candidatus Peregrinibacteria bacterium]
MLCKKTMIFLVTLLFTVVAILASTTAPASALTRDELTEEQGELLSLLFLEKGENIPSGRRALTKMLLPLREDAGASADDVKEVLQYLLGYTEYLYPSTVDNKDIGPEVAAKFYYADFKTESPEEAELIWSRINNLDRIVRNSKYEMHMKYYIIKFRACRKEEKERIQNLDATEMQEELTPEFQERLRGYLRSAPCDRWNSLSICAKPKKPKRRKKKPKRRKKPKRPVAKPDCGPDCPPLRGKGSARSTSRSRPTRRAVATGESTPPSTPPAAASGTTARPALIPRPPAGKDGIRRPARGRH